ncbi:ROK family glucokinase [Acetilactobacillus jinshanensis]|uniref:Glucokinase n=1 Tax=Acetilactobacillus jinshanensis TaxID=1720083 RepID=A0A4P6ZM45_9LACO|nr:ROK family glucokinase [Acetilactobacillus jinshanensis]QBP18647.1 ROK family glucokinase [Acetilactobacillus jinshanensis]URL61523.1 ROK family glucokinase [uncultured bacterium]
MADKLLIGIDLGGTTTKMAFLEKSGKIIDKWRIKTDTSDNGNHIAPNIAKSINSEMTKTNHTKDEFLGMGMGTPGTIDNKAGTVYGAYNLNWGDKHQVKSVIEKGVGLPLIMDNDANVAALGEFRRGAGSKDQDIVFVTLGTGVGGGIITEGHLLHGCNGDAGEIGHICVKPGGYMCTCGKRGCLEQYASATGVVHIAHDMAEKFTTGKSRLKQLEDKHQKVTSKIVFYLADNGDILANQVVDRVCFYLGLALSDVANAFNPSNIIIGGGVSNAGNTLLQPTTRYFQENAFPPVRDSTKVQLAQLGNDAGAIGAGSLALKFDKSSKNKSSWDK